MTTTSHCTVALASKIMADSNLQNLEFQVVKNKKGRKNRAPRQIKDSTSLNAVICDINTALRRIDSSRVEILNSDFYKSFSASVEEGLGHLDNLKGPSEIVCFGLGRISDCIISRYQLALLLALKQHFRVKIQVFDPIFTLDDVNILNKLDCELISENLEGKYKVGSLDKLTLFYLPHCPKQLSNNLLWANWGHRLSSCAIIANSFSKIIQNNSNRTIDNDASYITNIAPYTIELKLSNCFKYKDIFNDLALHVFPLKKLSLIDAKFWENNDEPLYPNCDVEFIRKKLEQDI